MELVIKVELFMKVIIEGLKELLDVVLSLL